MRRQKSKFWNFIFSCLPGAGHMYLGFMKQGISLMLIFWGIIAVAGWANLDIVLFLLPVLWFYSFFDSLNKNAMPHEQFEKLEDNFIWVKELEINFVNKRTVRIVCSVLFIVMGIIMLINNVLNIMYYYAGSELYWYIDSIMHYAYQIIFAFVIIGLGIKLIAGKKKEIDSRAVNNDTNIKTEKNAADIVAENSSDIEGEC